MPTCRADRDSNLRQPRLSPLLAWLLGAAALFTCINPAHAAAAWRCVDAAGQVAFQDTPCPTAARTRPLDLPAQPLIGAPGEAAARLATVSTQASPIRERARARHAPKTKTPMSWECQAADGEVFYRHGRCPSSIAGDGVARETWTRKPARSRGRQPNAWSRIAVHGVKVPRAEACQRIHAVAASSRDGYRHDEDVSVYDRAMGRDPCHPQ